MLRFIALFLLATTTANAINIQKDSIVANIPPEELTFVTWEEQPEFPGGIKALTTFIEKNIQYPKEDCYAMHEGRAFVNFAIDTLGFIHDIKLFKSCGYENLDKEAMRLVSIMPNWKPATLYNKKINFRLTLPITFRLTDEDKRIFDAKSCDKEPSFPGNEKSLFKWLNENLQQRNKIKYEEFTIIPVQFTINRDGSVCNIHIMEQSHKSLHPEIIRLLSSMPKWKPATIKRNPVRCSVNKYLYISCDDSCHLKIVKHEQPKFKGGENAFYEFLKDVVIYPTEARKAGIEGKSYINFVIEANGKVSNVKVVKSSGNTQLDEEAIRIIQYSSQKWKPGTIDGKKARIMYTVPISFKLK